MIVDRRLDKFRRVSKTLPRRLRESGQTAAERDRLHRLSSLGGHIGVNAAMIVTSRVEDVLRMQSVDRHRDGQARHSFHQVSRNRWKGNVAPAGRMPSPPAGPGPWWLVSTRGIG